MSSDQEIGRAHVPCYHLPVLPRAEKNADFTTMSLMIHKASELLSNQQTNSGDLVLLL